MSLMFMDRPRLMSVSLLSCVVTVANVRSHLLMFFFTIYHSGEWMVNTFI